MSSENQKEQVRIIGELRKFDTATICNVVATYPESDICLKLYDAWRGEYYTDTSIRCIYPEYPPVCGYAATAWYSDERAEHTKLDPWALPDHLDKTPKPVVLVAKQTYSEGLENLSGLFGGNMTTEFKALGVDGVLTDGPIRDYVEIKEMNMQYLASGMTSGHGPTQLRGAGIPVKVAGMTVVPGDIIHMDQCGACKFPADKLPQVLSYATELISREKKFQATFHEPGFSLQKWKSGSKGY
ncbi:MAG: RraA family protein [Thaumarchaeota archaeon]|nr:RraA family protein [Nitrososphaerota archaeon]